MSEIENENYNFSTENEDRKRSPLLLILLILSLLANAYLAYNYYKSNFKNGVSLKEENKRLLEVIEKTSFSKDSLQEEYDKLLLEYDILKQNAENNNITMSEKDKEIDQLKLRVRQLLSQSNGDPRALLKLREENEKLKKELVEYQVKLDQTIADSGKEIELAKEQNKALEEQKNNAEKTNRELEDKISQATFKISDLKAVPQQQRKKGLEPTTKSSKVDQIEVSFTILESPLIKEGEKELLLRIVGTKGEVLGADNSVLADSDGLFTEKLNFNYDGTSQKFKMKYKQDEAFKAGNHVAEIWSDGKMIIRTAFNLE
ncbi:MAG: hypothetical protein H6607_10065 [Flavobacteriales bacterium]|nr:hypothetical protein [Flavobacteriales bacterium]